MNGTPTASYAYDAANQVVGRTYDAAGNLTGDGTTTYSYDALSRLTGTTATGQTRAYTYNGDGTLVAATANSTATTYTQDLAGGLSQILARQTGGVTTDYLYGQERLAALSGGVRTWYGADAQGSVRQTLSDAGAVTGTQSYDPWGVPEGGTAPVSFGYAGELQDGATNQVYLRARWYQPARGQLLGVDPVLDSTGQPYAYVGDNPVNGSDPSGLAPIQDEINQLLQHVLDTWTQIVTPGDQRPPGNLPWRYFIGTQVHIAIAKYYARESGSIIYANFIPLSTILEGPLGVGADASALSAEQLAWRPDILDVTYRRIYEIKPYTGYADAEMQLNRYMAAFNAAHVRVTPGPTAAPGTSGIVSAPGGYAVFASPAPGIILYRKFNGTYTPTPAQNATCSAVQATNAVVTIVFSIFGIVIRIILSPGPSGSPALA